MKEGSALTRLRLANSIPVWVGAASVLAILLAVGGKGPLAFLAIGVSLAGLAWMTRLLARSRRRLEAIEGYFQETEERFRLAVESSPNAMVMVDPHGTILLVNAEAERLFGYSRDELEGNSMDILVPDRFKARHPDLRAKFVEHPLKRPMGAGRDLYGLRKDGTEIPIEIGLNPIRSSKGMLILSAIVDITERKRAEEVVAAKSRELARSNEELEQFAYVASHDLQEPLRAVAGSVQLLQRKYEGALDDRADEFIHHAVEGAVRMQTLINDLLAFSRVATQGQAPRPTDLNLVARDALERLQVAIAESGAEVDVAELPTVPVDRVQISQVFQNLIGNAIKFRGERPPRVLVRAERAPERWILHVRDNGIGIDPQHFKRLFIIFKRLHTRAEYPGTGIGLALCKKIVERHGGSIWVDSVPGEGSTFSFSIPDRGAP